MLHYFKLGISFIYMLLLCTILVTFVLWTAALAAADYGRRCGYSSGIAAWTRARK